MVEKGYKVSTLIILSVFIVIFSLNFVSAESYLADVRFTVRDTVYTTGARIELRGQVLRANTTSNGSLSTQYAVLPNAPVNLTIRNKNGTYNSEYNLTADSNGTFYSKSNFYPTATEINASSVAGDYIMRAQYKDPVNTTWFSEVEITVVNKTLDLIKISSNKATYYPSENITIEIEAIKLLGDQISYVANVSMNGSLRNASKYSISTFNCTTQSNGKCSLVVAAPSTYGNYILEAGNFKAFGSFNVIPFSFNIYMKDELGKSLKNIFAVGEQGRVQVTVLNASSTDVYTFSGYISNSSLDNIKTITPTILRSNNSFANSFLFTIDALTFSYGAYKAYVTVVKSGDGSISSSTSFEVQNWELVVNKKESDSGFEYAYSIYKNKTMNFEAHPKYRVNGSMITNLTASYFTIDLKDELNNVLSTTNASWNESCSTAGCYEYSLQSPSNIGEYTLSVGLAHAGSVQTKNIKIKVIDSILSATSTDIDGNLKELFGTNEYVYLSLAASNLTNSSFNLENAEIFTVSYMNGSQFTYVNAGNFSNVNASNSNYEWAWNSSVQRIKMDVPKSGGLYNVFIFGNNRTIGTNVKFIVNPYDSCIAAKDTPGSVSSGYYYVWQFKTTDTVYFEIKLTQANNPIGKAPAENATGNSSTYGMASQCRIDTSTQQIVNNATLTLVEAKNLESGAIQQLNTTESTCQASDSSGGYTCTVKPLSKWDGGVNIVKINILGQDGASKVIYGKFESRAFYLYGWSNVWQNGISANITLNVRLYEAGGNWWSGHGSSGGLSGTITLKKIEYQGSFGEWLSVPVDSGYNASNVNASSVTNGVGTLSIPVSNLPARLWKTGYYRAIIEGKTSGGDTDYGYAWFGVKLWDVYGNPVECTSSLCNYKNYFNSKENITLYIKISKAGDYSYSYQGGQAIDGNVTIGVKKIDDCRKWPCKELNSSSYNASRIIVNESSPWYWNANSANQGKYILQINSTTGSWGTGYYNVVLDINGTDTGYAWFSSIAFYVDTRPTDQNGTNYIYNIKPNQAKYFNITTLKSYKGWYGYYNESDYINVTLDDVVLRAWNEQTWQSIEYNYPENINVTPTGVNGTKTINITFNNGSWPNGYYWGEITYRNSDNETTSGYIYFNVRPFRVDISTASSDIDSTSCINATIRIYEPDWSSNTLIAGNYSILSAFENIWNVGNRNIITYSNYTSYSFGNSTNITICPNNGSWGSGSWGGYHYLTLVINDSITNSTENGWLYFRAVPFKVSWGSIYGGTAKLTNANVILPVNLTTYSTGAITRGNLSGIYQWRYENYYSKKEYYNFSIGACYSNVSGQCTVSNASNLTIYAPGNGWKVGYNYLYAEWNSETDSTSKVEDYSGIYIEGRTVYNGYYNYRDLNGNYKYEFLPTENITIEITVRNLSYDRVDVNITAVQYAFSGTSCWDEWCRSYTDAIYSPTNTSNGTAILNIKVPTGGWSRGTYYIKTTVSGSGGTVTITEGNVRVKDMTAPNVTIITPVNNQTINNRTAVLNATTTESAQCTINVYSFDNFNRWYCSSNSSNSTLTSQTINACNHTLYGYNGTSEYNLYIDQNYISSYNGSYYSWSSGTTGLSTGGTRHLHTINLTNLPVQHYGIVVRCCDDDWNCGQEFVAVSINATINSSILYPQVAINRPPTYYNSTNVTFNFTLDKTGYCEYSLNNGSNNYTMSTSNNIDFSAINATMTEGNHTVFAYCNDSFGNKNNTAYKNFTIDLTYPTISYSSATPNNYANLSQRSVYVNVSIRDSHIANITFTIANKTNIINTTTYLISTYQYTQSCMVTTALCAYSINWTNLAYGNYTYNVSVYDHAGNYNITDARNVNLSADDGLAPTISISSPVNGTYYSTSSITFNFTLNKNGICKYSINYGAANYTMSTSNNRTYTGTNSSVPNAYYLAFAYCNDTVGHRNDTEFANFTVDTIYPLITNGTGSPNNYANLTQNSIYVNVSWTEVNFKNITFYLFNNSGTVNTSVFTIASYTINWTSLGYTNYTYYVKIYDKAGNFNQTASRYVNLSAG